MGQQSPADQQKVLEQHLEQVKRSNPRKYQEMLDKAGGVARDCRDCHTDI